MIEKNLLYEGKAKKIYAIPDNTEQVLVRYKNDLTAFNALKKGSFEGKGSLNRNIASLLFSYLKKHNISSHWISDLETDAMIVQKVQIIPLEVVVRNKIAGSLAKKMGVPEGKDLKNPLVEFYFKNDELGDPFLSEDQVLAFEIATSDQISELKNQARKINTAMKELFFKIGIDLIDFKIEFGLNSKKEILLADEISPDCARLWDFKSGEKLDKDRFRKDLGNIQESYQEVFERLNNFIKG